MIRFVSASFIRSSSYYAEVSGGLSASLVSSSFTTTIHNTVGTLDANLTSSAIELILPSQSTGASNDINALVVSASNDNASIGIGTTNPLTSLDIRSITASDPANIILRTNEDGVIQVGEETGRVIFAIESSSYLGTDFIASGSTAAIYSRVEGSDSTGAYGSLIFEVNDSSDVTTPVEVIKAGYGADPTYNGVGISMSASIVVTSANPTLRIENPDTGHQIVRLGGHSPIDLSDGQLLLFNQGNESVKLNGDAAPADASFIRYGNFALGTTTAPEKLTVEGNISASGDITATNGSFSGNVTVEGDIIAQNYIVSSSVTYMTQSFSSGSTIFGDTLDDTHQFTGSVDITGSLTVDGMLYPTTDGLDRQVLKTDGNGNLTFGYSENVEIAVKNVSGGTIFKGTPCFITASGTSGNIAGIIPGDAGDPTKMPVGIIAGEDILDEAEGLGLINGFIQGVDTSTFVSGDAVYVAVGGGYTNIKPTGSALIQKLGNVEKSDANGSGVINGPGYYNEVPNLLDNQIFFGSGSNQSQQIHISGALDSTTINNITASGEIETNTISNVTTVIASDSATNVDTFATSTYNGAIYDYVLKDSTVGARAGQFMVAHDNGSVTFTDNSTKHLFDSTAPEITADISGGDVRVRVTNGNGYTFKSFVKKL